MSKLKYLAKIKKGVNASFIRKISYMGTGDTIKLIDRKAIKDGKLNNQSIEEVQIQVDSESKISTLKKGDILLPKNINEDAFYVDDDKDKMIATANYYIISLNPNDDILPEYVAWWLNQYPAKNNIYANNQRMVFDPSSMSLEAVKNMEIKTPSMDEQRKIITINEKVKEIEEKTLKSLQLQKDMLNSLAQRIDTKGTIKNEPESDFQP